MSSPKVLKKVLKSVVSSPEVLKKVGTAKPYWVLFSERDLVSTWTRNFNVEVSHSRVIVLSVLFRTAIGSRL